jgi:hypothetical protein
MERNLAVLIDFENIATGCEKEGLGRFDVRIVMRRLKDKGRILVSRSYADWGRWSRFKTDLVHEGITMVELTSHGMQDKNRADIALAVDAMEIAYTRDYLDTFVILSGDSDFTPLVMRLKELNKRVIGCGTRGSTSRLIAEVCDEFIYYDVLRREAIQEVAADDEGALTLDEAFELLVETLENHQRDEPAPIHGSILKASMKRKQPTFNEVELGMRTFARFLESAQQRGLVVLSPDAKAGGVRVDLPVTREEQPRQGPLAGDAALALLKILQNDGLEVGIAADRRVVTDLLVSVCQERARRNRKCAVQWVLGDLLRRVKQEKVQVPSRVVKGIVGALVKSGALMHPDGEPIRAGTATFVPPNDADGLRARLEAFLRETLASHGVATNAPGIDEIVRGADNGAGRNGATRPSSAPAAPPTEPAATLVDAPAAAVDEPVSTEPAARARRGGRGRRKSDAPTAPDATSDAPAAAAALPAEPDPAAVDEDVAEGDADTAEPARRRSRRGGRRGRTPAGEATEG